MILIDELVRQGALSEADGEAVLSEYREAADQDTPIDVILEKHSVSEDAVLHARSTIFGIPIRKLDVKTISQEALRYIAEDSALHYKFIPLKVSDGVLEVGIVDPEFLSAKDALQFISSKIGLPYKVFLISHSDFEAAVETYKGISGEVDQALTELEAGNLDANESSDSLIANVQNQQQKDNQNTIIEDAPVTKIVASLLRHAIEENASDIHIEHMGDKVRARFRMDGQLETSIVLPAEIHNAIVARIKILSSLKLDEKRKPQDGRFASLFEGRKIDFRVSSLPAYYGEKVVIRILDSYKGVKPLDSVGLNGDNLKLIREAIKRPYGLILISGPTGSGKTTTLYSMLNEIDREKQNVVSLEDPVEYNIPSMTQSQIMPEIGYTFATGLRSILRQDPDVIMVGEIRDKETAQLAIQAALTGHLVLSTIHTNNAIGVIPRLIDMGVDPYLIAPTLILTIAQRLARQIHPSAKQLVPNEGATKAMIEKQFADLPKEFRDKLDLTAPLYDAVPTEEAPSGTQGRLAVFEMLEIDKDLEQLILKGAEEPAIRELARKKGMITMREDALLKSMQGLVPIKEAYYL